MGDVLGASVAFPGSKTANQTKTELGVGVVDTRLFGALHRAAHTSPDCGVLASRATTKPFNTLTDLGCAFGKQAFTFGRRLYTLTYGACACGECCGA